MKLGVVDDIAVLSETDLRNKEKIAERKSMYSQMQGQLGSQEEQIKDLNGTIETLQRQLVQAGIKSQIQDASVEINKQKESAKTEIHKHRLQTEAETKFAGKVINDEVNRTKKSLDLHQQQRKDKLEIEFEKVIEAAKRDAMKDKGVAE